MVATGLEQPESFFLHAADGVRLLAHFHRPVEPCARALVFCAPFGDEQVATHRMLWSLAGELAARGVAVLRFDPRGLGDSQGELVDASLEVAERDLSTAIDALRERTREAAVGVLGVRLGAVLAARRASEGDIAFAALLAPMLRVERFFMQLLRRQAISDAMYGMKGASGKHRIAQLQAGEVLDVGGYRLSRQLFDSYCSFDTRDALQKLGCPLWVGLPRTNDPDAAGLEAVGNLTLAQADEPTFWEFPPDGSICFRPDVLTESFLGWMFPSSERRAAQSSE